MQEQDRRPAASLAGAQQLKAADLDAFGLETRRAGAKRNDGGASAFALPGSAVSVGRDLVGPAQFRLRSTSAFFLIQGIIARSFSPTCSIG